MSCEVRERRDINRAALFARLINFTVVKALCNFPRQARYLSDISRSKEIYNENEKFIKSHRRIYSYTVGLALNIINRWNSRFRRWNNLPYPRGRLSLSTRELRRTQPGVVECFSLQSKILIARRQIPKTEDLRYFHRTVRSIPRREVKKYSRTDSNFKRSV